VLPDRNNQVRVRANFPGEVEVLVHVGDAIHAGQALVVVEGDKELERLSARNAGRVVEVLVRSGQDVAQGALLVVLEELKPQA
jgi:biotin carboxyl carrier protein